jgi:MFS family permease
MAGLLSRERIIARPGFNRWLVPPAALAIHLCIGQAYAFSVFKIPLSRAVGITESVPGDWKFTQLQWIFTLAIVWLGLSAAIAGRWLERAGPRKGGVVAAICWGSGFLITALGVYLHKLWLLYLGYGFVGGWGLGIGYISPVSTLIKWFPDRRGMATGMAIMGFGGGALIAAPLSDILMKHYASATDVGVWQTFLTMGAIYFVAMMCGAFGYRLPPPDWKPAGWSPPVQRHALVTTRQVHVDQAIKTPQFYLLWMVLCMNVSAGIGVIEQASPMIQEIFKGAVTASAAAGFVGLLSLFNIGGRIFWASLSDYIRRKPTYTIFFILGSVTYASIPFAGRIGSVPLFVACALVILTMYGGGFATIPAYIADIFGTQFVGAIHGRLLTAWSVAGVLGPALVNYIREYQVAHGVPKADAYNVTMYVMVGLLVVGFFCNLAMRPLAERHYMSDAQLDIERRLIAEPKR